MMLAIILDGTIERLALSTNDGDDLTDRIVHELTEGEIALSQAGQTLAWTGSGLAVALEAAKQAKLAAIAARFETEVKLGCNSPLGRVDCDDTAQVRIANIIALRERAVAANMVIDAVVRWTMFDGSQINHDDADLQGLGFAIGFGFAAKFAVKQAHEQAVADAADHNAVDNIDETQGWPG